MVERRRERRQRRQPDDRFGGCECDTARSREADSEAGETTRPGGHRDAVDIEKTDPGSIHHPAEQRHQRHAAFEHVLTRPPSRAELAECEAFIKQSVSAPVKDGEARVRESLVRALLNQNDFLTVR